MHCCTEKKVTQGNTGSYKSKSTTQFVISIALANSEVLAKKYFSRKTQLLRFNEC